jgi:hypothetical protein
MDLKFYLNKFLKADNIEHYTYKALLDLKKCYSDFLETSEGIDPDFPMSNFGGAKGTKVSGTNIHRLNEDDKELFKERLVSDSTGNKVDISRSEKPEAKEEFYKDKRASMDSRERALMFLKNNNLR